jgi:hypothetical protein
MKILIAILTCHAMPERAAASRRTWLRRYNGDYKFFLGRGQASADDEVILDIGDTYDDHPDKLRAIYLWALARDYDYVFSADDDTYVVPERLFAMDFQDWDYIGRSAGPAGMYPEDYASGGPGVWLSKKVMQILVTSRPAKTTFGDKWIGDTLRERGILCHKDERMQLPRDFKQFRNILASCEANTSRKNEVLSMDQLERELGYEV